MKVLMLSGDRNLLVPGTSAYERLQLQKAQVEQLDVFVWPQVHSIWQILNAARKNHYDVITAQDPLFRGHLAHHLKQFFGGKLNIQVHSDLSAMSPLWRTAAHFHLRHADSIRVVSQRLKDEVVRINPRARVDVLPVFIDGARFARITPVSHEGKVILWIGRFEVEKDPFAALGIIRRVREVVPEAKLVMLGAGSLERALRKCARGLPVEFAPWQDPAPHLAQADVVLSTSREESYGASVIEALAAGVVVVAPDVGVAKEAGAIVVPREKLADAVIEALRSGTRGELKLALLTKEEWAKRWKETLL